MGNALSLLFPRARRVPQPNVQPSPTLENPTAGAGLWLVFDHTSERASLPLRSSHAKVHVRDIAAQVVLTQTFGNPHCGNCSEAVFVFPLEARQGHDSVSVCGVEAIIGSRRVIAQCKESQLAREEYLQARAAGHTAYLVEEVPNGTLFTLRLGNVPARTEVVVSVTFACVLSSVEWRSPTLDLLLPAACLIPATTRIRSKPRQAHLMDLQGMDYRALHRVRGLSSQEAVTAEAVEGEQVTEILVDVDVEATGPISSMSCNGSVPCTQAAIEQFDQLHQLHQRYHQHHQRRKRQELNGKDTLSKQPSIISSTTAATTTREPVPTATNLSTATAPLTTAATGRTDTCAPTTTTTGTPTHSSATTPPTTSPIPNTSPTPVSSSGSRDCSVNIPPLPPLPRPLAFMEHTQNRGRVRWRWRCRPGQRWPTEPTPASPSPSLSPSSLSQAPPSPSSSSPSSSSSSSSSSPRGFQFSVTAEGATEPHVMIEEVPAHHFDTLHAVGEVGKPSRLRAQKERHFALLLSFVPTLTNYRAPAPSLTAVAQSTYVPQLNCELIFLIDRSGSMGGSGDSRMARAQKVMLQIAELVELQACAMADAQLLSTTTSIEQVTSSANKNVDDTAEQPTSPAAKAIDQAAAASSSHTPCPRDNVHFNLVGFGSTHSCLWHRSVRASKVNLDLLRQHVASDLKADMGGTDILTPLEAVLHQPVVAGCARQLFLLTDGEVDRAQQQKILSLVRQQSGSTRVFTVGLGNDVGQRFVQDIAAAGGGECSLVSDSGDLSRHMLAQVKRGVCPSLTRMSMYWDGLDAMCAPFRLKPAFNADPYRVFALVRVPEARFNDHQVPDVDSGDDEGPQGHDHVKHLRLRGYLPEGRSVEFVLPLDLRSGASLASTPTSTASTVSMASPSSPPSSGIAVLAARAMARDIEEYGSILHVPYPDCYHALLCVHLLAEAADLVVMLCAPHTDRDHPQRGGEQYGEYPKFDPSVARRELVRIGTTFQIVTLATSFVGADTSCVVAPVASASALPPPSVYRPRRQGRSMMLGANFLFKRMYGRCEMRMLMVGLDGAGKTTLLYKLKLGEQATTIPTIGFNVETIDFGGHSLTVWDVGGQDKIRPLWRHYYQNTQAVFFVVDSTDTVRFEQAYHELRSMGAVDELRGAALLVLANKQDQETACSVSHIAGQLGLLSNAGTRKPFVWPNQKVFIQGCSAVTGHGVHDALAWLVDFGLK